MYTRERDQGTKVEYEGGWRGALHPPPCSRTPVAAFCCTWRWCGARWSQLGGRELRRRGGGAEENEAEGGTKEGGGGGVVDSPPGRHRARSERCSATERREPALLVTQGRSEGGVSGNGAPSSGEWWGVGEASKNPQHSLERRPPSRARSLLPDQVHRVMTCGG